MNYGNKKVILTGATGLIGKETIKPLLDYGFEVFAIARNYSPLLNKVNFLQGNLFDKDFVQNSFEKIKPSYLLNLAWCTTGDYLSSENNYDYLQAGINLLKCFKENGGKRAIYAGTCFEYKFKDTPLSEDDELDCEKNDYTFCKNKLREIAQYYCAKNEISFGWGRIFYVFGKDEDKSRLFGMVQNNLLNNISINVKTGQLLRDYMYSKDIGAAFIEFLKSDVEGCVNICSGETINIEDFVLKAAKLKGSENLINIEYQKSSQPKIIAGSDKKLKENVKYSLKYGIDSALEDILNGK